MAQMTRFASFGPDLVNAAHTGPVLVISAHLNPRRSIKLYIEPKNDQLVHKKHDIILKKHVPRA